MKFGNREFPFSFSQYNLYRDCPMKYKFRYVDGIKSEPKPHFTLGSAVHKLCELSAWTLPTTPFEVVTEIRKNEQTVVDMLGKLYLTQLYRELSEFFKRRTIVASELNLQVPNRTAYIDCIYQEEKDDKTITVLVDFKTGKREKTQEAVYKDGQLPFYMYMYNEHFQDNLISWNPPESTYVQYISIKSYNAPTLLSYTVPENISQVTAEAVNREMESAVKLIEQAEFPKKTKWCNWCDYKELCDKT